jgi:hypothetical protein
MISFQKTVTQANFTVESRILIRDGPQLQVDSRRSRGYVTGNAKIEVGEKMPHAKPQRR